VVNTESRGSGSIFASASTPSRILSGALKFCYAVQERLHGELIELRERLFGYINIMSVGYCTYSQFMSIDGYVEKESDPN
jgi:hypothetical protein